MRLRSQLALAFFLMAVLPLIGVTLYTYLGAQAAIRRVVQRRGQRARGRDVARVDAVQDELEARLARMRNRPTGSRRARTRRRGARRWPGRRRQSCGMWLRSMLSEAERKAGTIPFALDAEGRLYAPEAKDEQTLGEPRRRARAAPPRGC